MAADLTAAVDEVKNRLWSLINAPELGLMTWRQAVGRTIDLLERRVRADERAKVRAELLAIGENEHHPLGRMRSLLRDLADKIAPEETT
jgi:hypothetical protein